MFFLQSAIRCNKVHKRILKYNLGCEEGVKKGGTFMTKTKYIGVYFRVSKDNVKTFYIKYKIKSNQYTRKVGSSQEGITAIYASKVRAKKLSMDRLGNDAPFANHDNKITFDAAFKMYYEHSKTSTRDFRTQLGRYEKHIENEIGHLSLEEISVKNVEEIKRKLLTNNSKTYSSGSINHLLDLIRTVFNFTIKEMNLNLTNPATSQRVKRLKIDNKRERYLEEDEINLLFHRVEEVYTKKGKHQTAKDKIKIFMMLSFSTGARLGSVCTIRKQDINFNQKTILIKNHKTGKTYTGYIHPNYEEFIKEKCLSLKKMDYIVSGNQSVYTQATLSFHLKPILDELFNQGIGAEDSQNRVVIHTFRHSFASLLAIQGTPIYTIMRLLDHSDISQTVRYAKLSPENGSSSVFSLKL